MCAESVIYQSYSFLHLLFCWVGFYYRKPLLTKETVGYFRLGYSLLITLHAEILAGKKESHFLAILAF